MGQIPFPILPFPQVTAAPPDETLIGSAAVTTVEGVGSGVGTGVGGGV